MNVNPKYAFNLRWRGVVICTGFYLGLAVFMAHLAEGFTGAILVCLVALSVTFTVLACIMMTRRLIFPRVLVLSEDAVLLPRGFPATRIVPIYYADIIRMWEVRREGQRSFCLVSGRGSFEIGTSHLPNNASYDAVREFICAKVSVAIPPHDERGASASKTWREFPDPILRWREPDDWARYRALLFSSKPLFPRLARAFWFSVRCFGIIILPWFVLLLCGVPTPPAVQYLSLALAVTLSFTLLHWLNAAHPVHATEISFRDNGITQFFGKQTIDWNYNQFSGWEVVERQFEGRFLHILLLQSRTGVKSAALPDTNIRDRLVQIFHAKKIPQFPDLRPSWETCTKMVKTG